MSGSHPRYVKIARFLLFILLIANSGNYLHLSIVVHYKTVCNNNVLSVNYNLIQIIKWMPPYWDNKALRTTYPNPYPILYFNFLIISFILLK